MTTVLNILFPETGKTTVLGTHVSLVLHFSTTDMDPRARLRRFTAEPEFLSSNNLVFVRALRDDLVREGEKGVSARGVEIG